MVCIAFACFVVASGQDSVKHYTVTVNDSGYMFGLAKFASMAEFVEHFQSQPLLGGESGNSRAVIPGLYLPEYVLTVSSYDWDCC